MSEMEKQYTIRVMTEKDIDEALRLFASLGYYESAADLIVFMRCDPNAFLVAVRNNDQKIIGLCVAPMTSHSTAFFGLYCVDNAYQNKGIGSTLFNKCLAIIGDRNCGLIGVKAMTLKYQNTRFGVKGYDLAIYTGKPHNLDSLCIAKSFTIKPFQSNEELIDKLIAYDTRIMNYNREKLIKLTLINDGIYTVIALNDNNNILGFGCIKCDIVGQKMIGPVYADNDSIAEALINSLLTQFESESDIVYMYTFVSSNGGTTIAEKMSLKNIEVCNELYTRFSPPINRELIYCMYSPSFSC